LCFDDLERKGKDLSIKEVLGYINSNFVEHNFQKVIIIGDESNITDKDDYDDIKEKVIGRTIKYELDKEKLGEVLQSFASGFETKNPDYSSYLREKKDFAINLFNRFEIKNLRTIRFFLIILEKVFSQLDEEKIEKLGDKVFYFTLAISNEYRDGGLMKNLDPDEEVPYFITQNHSFIDAFVLLNDGSFVKKEEIEKDELQIYQDEYLKKYRKDSPVEYIYLESLFEYIVSGILDENKLKDEINSIYSKRFVEVPPHIITLNKVSQFEMLSDEDFDENIRLTLDYIKEGKYSLYEFTTAGFMILRLIKVEVITELTVDDLCRILNENVEKTGPLTFKLEPKEHLNELTKSYEKICPGLGGRIEELYNKIDHKIKAEFLENQFKELKEKGRFDNSYKFQELILSYDPKKVFEFLIELLPNRAEFELITEDFKSALGNIHREKHTDEVLSILAHFEILFKKYLDQKSTGPVSKFHIKEILTPIQNKIMEIKQFLENEEKYE